MRAFTRAWLRREADYQGLPLDSADLDAIYDWVKKVKAALAALRADEKEGIGEEGLDSPYRFVIPKG